MTPPHKAEALRALAHLIARLESADPLDGMAQAQLRATAQYARESVERIAELKRARRHAPTDTPA